MPSFGRLPSEAWLAGLFCVSVAVFTPGQAAADERWLTVVSGGECAINESVLEDRVQERIVGERNDQLSVTVHVSKAGDGRRVLVRLQEGAAGEHTRSLDAPTCEEALEAVEGIVALALSSNQPEWIAPKAEGAESRPSSPVVSPGRTATSNKRVRAAAPAGGVFTMLRPTEERTPSPTSAGVDRERRLVFAAGVDIGTTVQPTAMVGAGALVPLRVGEVRALAWYGLPSSREEATSSKLESTRSDFMLLAASYCLGVGEGFWAGLCGGSTAGVTRVHVAREQGGTTFKSMEVATRLGATLGVAFAHRAVGWSPRAELTAEAPLLGVEDRRIAARVVLGVGMVF